MGIRFVSEVNAKVGFAGRGEKQEWDELLRLLCESAETDGKS